MLSFRKRHSSGVRSIDLMIQERSGLHINLGVIWDPLKSWERMEGNREWEMEGVGKPEEENSQHERLCQ